MDNRTNTRQPLHEAVNDQLIGCIIGLERVTSVLRLVQTLIVLLEWLIPLLEDVRMSRNQRDIIAMLKDNLLSLEAELQRQCCEMREHILGRYHRAMKYLRVYICLRHVIGIGDGVPYKSGECG